MPNLTDAATALAAWDRPSNAKRFSVQPMATIMNLFPGNAASTEVEALAISDMAFSDDGR